MPLVLIFFLTPILEMYLLIEVAGYINTLPTIFLVMLTAVIGVALLKHQGLATLTRGVGRLNRGEIPATEMAEGILLGIAGALLITPGFVTDGVGFLLLFPPSRALIAKQLLARVQLSGASSAHFSASASGSQGPSPSVNPDSPEGNKPITIEGDFEKHP
ncbi:MAG: hypothetical protein GKR90_21205 [Pseudomonadales bacterium]|nr:hypothetical protein [Pseudomonadales bacterium]